jgi:cytosine/adenosine deaminase-related metal-dependent hydrolase
MEDQALARFVEAAEAEGALCHVAVEDSGDEPSIVKRLDEAGVWNLGGVLLHRGPMAPGDEALLANREVWVAHAASSDMLARKGTPDLSRARSSGVRRALATDEGGGSLSESMRVAAYRQRSRGRGTRDAVRLVCDAAFEGGASLATRVFGAEVGRVKPGARADLVVFDYRPLAPLEGETLPEQVLWGALSAPVHSVIVNGRLSYQNGEFRGLDEERIRARAREAAKRVRERR